MSEPPAVSVRDLSEVVQPIGEAAGATSTGPVRSENQDVFEVVSLAGGKAALLVADGMGGMPGGGEAARAAADAVLASLQTDAQGSTDAAAAAHRANAAVGSLRDRIGGRPGTTLTMVLVTPEGRASIAHAGDSRAYLVRDGVATVLTTDHSWVGDQVRAGALQPGAERHHPRRNVITMAVMGEAMTPELVDLQLARGDVLLLCSDGFWEPLEDPTIAGLLSGGGSLPEVSRCVVEAALAAGATDNVTVVLLRVR